MLLFNHGFLGPEEALALIIRFLTLIVSGHKTRFNMKSMLIFYLVYEFLELMHVTQSYHLNFYSCGSSACLPAFPHPPLPSSPSPIFQTPVQELGSACTPGVALPPDHRLTSPAHAGLHGCVSPASAEGKSTLQGLRLLLAPPAATSTHRQPPQPGASWGSAH